jgi:hypothetical protein
MLINFKVNDVIHKITVKYIKAFLPNAKKTYYLRAVHQPELDIHGIASKAAIYNINTSPKVIEEGLNAGIELMYYLAADGYKIKTPLFNLRIRIPGEYNGSETYLPEGVFPVARLQTSPGFRKYLMEKVKVNFDGIDASDSIIAEVLDEATGLVDEVITRGNILTIRGMGIKLEGDEAHKEKIGVFFLPKLGVPVKASVIAVNEPRTLKVLVPTELKKGTEYRIAVGTQSSGKCNGVLLKKVQDIRTEFQVIAA